MIPINLPVIKLNDKWKDIPELSTDVYRSNMSFINDTRTLKHWEQLSIIPFKRISSKIPKYNFIELLWLNVVFELRYSNITLPRIKDVFDTIVGKDSNQWGTILHHILFESPFNYDIIIGKREIYQLIYGYPHFWIGNEFIQTKPQVALPDSYFKLSVIDILERTLRNETIPNTPKLYINYLHRKIDDSIF